MSATFVEGHSLLAELYRHGAAHPTAVSVISTLAAILLAWRFWRFTAVPILYPNEPKVLPYWIPFVGHTWAFMWHAENLLAYGNKVFRSHEPYALVLGGRETLILRDTDHVNHIWKDTAALSFDPFITSVMYTFGLEDSSVKKMYAPDPAKLIPEKYHSVSRLVNHNRKKQHYIHNMSEWLSQQLLPGAHAELLQDRYAGHLDRLLRWENLDPVYMKTNGATQKTVSLRNYTRVSLTNGANKTFFGKELFENSPDFIEGYKVYEDESWKIFFQYPKFMAKHLHEQKDKALDAMTSFLALPEEQRPETSWVMDTMNKELTYLGLPPRDRAGMIMLIAWAINNNAHSIGFWIIAHVTTDPELFKTVREETDRCFEADGTLNMDRLLHECPQLDAIWHEVLRVYNGASVAREAMVDTVVGGKEVPKGQKIVAPFRQFLLDGDVFGADPLIFNPERFLRKKNLHKAKGYSPFGGGSTYCPGRFFAQREIYMFIAWTYQRFDLSVEPGAVIPPIDLATPCPAAMKPNGDMNVTLKPRVHRK